MSEERRHTDREYEGELRALREELVRMGACVQWMIDGSVRALLARNAELAKSIIDSDHEVNRLELEIDERSLTILARRQPVASDLRFIATAFKVVTDLERIADLAASIGERVVELCTEPPLRPCDDIARMADDVQSMLRDALDAFLARDAERAHAILERDDAIDAAFGRLFRELVALMMEDPGNVKRALRHQSIARYLERIADHVTNVAEMVVFMTSGQDIRHPFSRDVRRKPTGNPPR